MKMTARQIVRHLYGLFDPIPVGQANQAKTIMATRARNLMDDAKYLLGGKDTEVLGIPPHVADN